MSFMSVPALDRLLEPSKPESTSVRSWSAKADKRTDMNMSPLFPPQPLAQPSPPQSRASSTIFSPSPYVLNFKRRVFDGNGTNDATVEVSCHNVGVAMQSTESQVCDATSLFKKESEVVSELRNKVVNNKTGLNKYGMLPEMEIQERLNLRGKSSKAHERFEVKNIDKAEKLMTTTVIKTHEAKHNGWQRQESSGGLKSRNPLIRQPNIEFSSISLSNLEEFFDAPEEPFEDIASDEESLRAQKNPRSIPGDRHDVNGYLKSQLDQEIKRRMAAEDAMALLQLQCTEMAFHLTSVDEESHDLNDSGQNDWNSGSQAQKLVIAQVVAYSVARGAARAEVNEEMENMVTEKNREIARLQDKLHYYELVNHEMSQHNQEAFELARSRRHIRRNRNQWLMVCTGSALCVGVSAILVSKFAPWATAHFPSKFVFKSHMRTNVNHSSPSHDI